MKTLLTVATLFMLFCGCSDVKDGVITKCKHCEKEITNTVQTRSVAAWDSSVYKIQYEMTYCNQCGNEKVETHKHHVCFKCKDTYDTETSLNRRSEERADQIVKNGFCKSCGDERIPSTEIFVCARCEKSQVWGRSNSLRSELPNPKTFKGTVKYKDDCIICRAADGSWTLEHHIDSRKFVMTPPTFHCQSCKKLVAREKAARKVGDALGGLGGAFTKGIKKGIDRSK